MEQIKSNTEAVYFDLIQTEVFSLFSQLAREVSLKSDLSLSDLSNPNNCEEEEFKLSNGELLLVTVHVPVIPQRVILQGQDVGLGMFKTILSMHDSYESTVSFQRLDDGSMIFKNENIHNSERFLTSPDSLFKKVDQDPLSEEGCPAAWLNRLISDRILDRMLDKLATQSFKKRY